MDEFKYLRNTQNIVLLNVSLLLLDNFVHSLGADTQKDLYPSVDVWLVHTIKTEPIVFGCNLYQYKYMSILAGIMFALLCRTF